MLREIEKLQLFLISNPDEDCALTEPNLISYTMIKITNTGGMYTKGIEEWQKRTPQDRRKWAEFSAHMVEDYEQHIINMERNTMVQEGYGTAIHAVEDLTYGVSIMEKVTKYVEKATHEEERMAQMEAKFEEKSP